MRSIRYPSSSYPEDKACKWDSAIPGDPSQAARTRNYWRGPPGASKACRIRPAGALEGGVDFPIFTAVIEQRPALGLVIERQDLADDDDVVAAVMDAVGFALEHGQRVLERRDPDAT